MSKRAPKHRRFVLYRNPCNGTIVVARQERVRNFSKGERMTLTPIVDLRSDGDAAPGNYRYNWYTQRLNHHVVDLAVAAFLGEADEFAEAVAAATVIVTTPASGDPAATG